MDLYTEIRARGFNLYPRDDGAIAAALSEGRTKIVSTPIGVGTILAKFAGTGGAFLDALAALGQTDRDVHWLLESNIKQGTFDVGDPIARVRMQALAEALPQFAVGINALLDLAVVPDVITAQDVARALEGK